MGASSKVDYFKMVESPEMPIVCKRMSNLLACALLFRSVTKKKENDSMIRKALVVIYILSVLAISATADASESSPGPSLGWISK